MLSTKYRLKVERIRNSIKLQQDVPLCDMIWYNKITRYNNSARGLSQCHHNELY